MTTKRAMLLSGLAYVVATFPLAIVWHLVLFREPYESIRYIQREEPGFLLALLSMLIQGAMLAWAYPKVFPRDKRNPMTGLTFSLVVGLFFWTAHVLAHAAKVEIGNLPLFIVLETLWLTVQFGLFGFATGWLHGRVKAA